MQNGPDGELYVQAKVWVGLRRYRDNDLNPTQQKVKIDRHTDAKITIRLRMTLKVPVTFLHACQIMQCTSWNCLLLYSICRSLSFPEATRDGEETTPLCGDWIQLIHMETLTCHENSSIPSGRRALYVVRWVPLALDTPEISLRL